MKELIYLRTEASTFKDKKYNVSTFIDIFNYKIIRGTDLPNVSKLEVGNKYLCDLDVKFNSNRKEFVFFVSKVKI